MYLNFSNYTSTGRYTVFEQRRGEGNLVRVGRRFDTIAPARKLGRKLLENNNPLCVVIRNGTRLVEEVK